jgi:nitrilase
MVRVAAIQMVSTADVETNLSNAAELIQQAIDVQADFLTLPENFPLMGHDEHDKVSIAESYGKGPIQEFLQNQASKNHIWLLGGTIPLQASVPDKIRAASLLYNPEGECVARYDKIHLFDALVESGGDEAYNESGTIESGEEIIVAETTFANIGMSVCYDLRFPELYRSMHAHNVSIIAVPSAFTATTGKAHWKSLLRARAVENLCFVIAPNQGGKHINERETWGHSMIIDPWGEILALVDEGPDIACAELDMEKLTKLRKSFPTLEHRKLKH